VTVPQAGVSQEYMVRARPQGVSVSRIFGISRLMPTWKEGLTVVGVSTAVTTAVLTDD
jgi:hypothetical protein